MKRAAKLLASLTAVTVAACGGSGTAPAVTAPEPPAVVVTFASDAVNLKEGETVDITVRYRINNLSSPLSLAISPLDRGAAAEDYELSATTFDIPAGQGVTGTAALSLIALEDNQIAEGEEVVALRLLPPGGIRAQLDQNLEVTIGDVGASPCAGVRVLATPIEPIETSRNYRGTTLELTQGKEAGAVWFDWEGPYLHGEYCDDDDCRTAWQNRFPILEVNLVEWRMESSSSGTEDFLEIEWNDSNTLRFRFRSPDGACDGEPTVACTTTGCELDQ